MSPFVEDVTFMMATGETAERIADRLGVKLYTVRDTLRRQGRMDVWRDLRREQREAQGAK